MLFRRVNLKIFLKFRFESFPILINVLCKGRVIELCNIEIVLISVLVFLHESQIRSTFFSGSRASPRVKIKKSLYVKTGAIIGDGDRKRAPFQVLGLSP